MTKLTDQGYLETDDPVVMATAFGKEVTAVGCDGPEAGILGTVSVTGEGRVFVEVIQYDDEIHDGLSESWCQVDDSENGVHLLIPASVVAEVCGALCSDDEQTAMRAAIARTVLIEAAALYTEYEYSREALGKWLTIHTGE